jgi:hypothetical protein
MPYEADDQQLVEEAIADAHGSNKLLVRDPAESQKLGWFSVMCTIWNRTIGTSSDSCQGIRYLLSFDRRVWHLCRAGDNIEGYQ